MVSLIGHLQGLINARFGMVSLIPKSQASAGSLSPNHEAASHQQCPPDSNTFAQISQETQTPTSLYLFL